MSVYVSPFLLSKLQQHSVQDLVGEPILTCPRCRFSLSRTDLDRSSLWIERTIKSPNDQILVIINFWPCLNCGIKLYRSAVQLKDLSNRALKIRIEAAIEGIRSELELTKKNWKLSELIQKIEILLTKVESQAWLK